MKKLTDKAQKLLDMLRADARHEINNIELVGSISHRFSIYVEELRKAGFDLETRRLATNKFSTILHEPSRNDAAPPMASAWR